MSFHWSVWAALGLCLLGVYCLIHINRRLSEAPDVATKIAGSWSDETIKTAYQKCLDADDRTSTAAFTQYLPPKQQRRYVVVGGSGLVGGWIVEHLLMRGEDPQAIRIADLQAPRRQLAVEHDVVFFKTDITDAASVARVFAHPWSPEHADRPLTVFHTVAFIHAGLRKADFLAPFMRVNVGGTENVLSAAKAAAGCDVFIATSSASIGIRPVRFFFPPWQRYPANFVQFSSNAEPKDLDAPLERFAGCYAYSKARAESVVRRADDRQGGFRTGAIRPGHAIYGHGDENPSSIVYDYMTRGYLPTWMSNVVVKNVSAQNVSLAHLLFEARIHAKDLGGNAYCVCDPGPAFASSNVFRVLSLLAHPTTPMQFPSFPPLMFMLPSYLVEAYHVLQHRYLTFLPEPTGDIRKMQPAMFNYSSIHMIYDDSRAREELGYNPGADTLEGLCLHMKEWNDTVEAKLAAGKASSRVRKDVQADIGAAKSVPVASTGVAM